MPDLKTTVAALATIGIALQFFGFTMPNAKRADANKVANFTARDAWQACEIKNQYLIENWKPRDTDSHP